MMSPIAIKSAIKARDRAAAGETIKHTGNRRTEYTRPPIVEQIAKCASIEELGAMRMALSVGAYRGDVQPSEKTEREWERAFWKRVLELMLTADGETVCPTFIYNYVLTWSKPAAVAAAIEAALEAVMPGIPNRTERLRRKGINIEGVT